jgi:DNA polymerase III epsilon subunit-like protein
VARHDAASDALATAELFLILLERGARKGLHDACALRRCAEGEEQLARLRPR